MSESKVGTAEEVAISSNITNTVLIFISGDGVITLNNLLETESETL